MRSRIIEKIELSDRLLLSDLLVRRYSPVEVSSMTSPLSDPITITSSRYCVIDRMFRIDLSR